MKTHHVTKKKAEATVVRGAATCSPIWLFS